MTREEMKNILYPPNYDEEIGPLELGARWWMERCLQLQARVKELEPELERLNGMKVDPNNACAGCRKTFAENYGFDWYCQTCSDAMTKHAREVRDEIRKLKEKP